MESIVSVFASAPVKDPSAPRKRKKLRLPKVISLREAEAILVAAERRGGTKYGARNRLGLELMYRAGLRVSEVCNMMPRDLHPEGYIDIYDAKGGDGTAYFDAERVNPLVDKWMEQRNVPDGSPLICHLGGKPMTTRYWQRLCEDLKEDVGIAGIAGIFTPHVLRHTFATELLEDGFSLVEVQNLLRHRHLSTTAVYLHVRDKSLQAKMAKRTPRREV